MADSQQPTDFTEPKQPTMNVLEGKKESGMSETIERYVCFRQTDKGHEIMMDVSCTFSQALQSAHLMSTYDKKVSLMTYKAYKEWNPKPEQNKEDLIDGEEDGKT